MLRGLETLRQMVGSRSAAPLPRAARTSDLAGGGSVARGGQGHGRSGGSGQKSSKGISDEAWSPKHGVKRKREVNGEGIRQAPTTMQEDACSAEVEQPHLTCSGQSNAIRNGVCSSVPQEEREAAVTGMGNGIMPLHRLLRRRSTASIVDDGVSSRMTRFVQMTFSHRSVRHEGGVREKRLHLQTPQQQPHGIQPGSSSPAADSGPPVVAVSSRKGLAEGEDAAGASELRAWIVGRRHGSRQPLIKGTAVLAVRERDNPRDVNAVQIWTTEARSPATSPAHTSLGPAVSSLQEQPCQGRPGPGQPGRLLGHLPRAVAARVAPVLDALERHVLLEGHVLATPRTASARASIALRAPVELCAAQQSQTLRIEPAEEAQCNRTKPRAQEVDPVDLVLLWEEAVRVSEQGEGAEPRRDATEGVPAEASIVEGQPLLQDGRGLRGGAGYAERFGEVVRHVVARDSHLLSADELGVLHTMLGLPDGAQRLLVRLLLRRGPWFRVASLAYQEVPDIAGAAASLVGSSLCSDGTVGHGQHKRAAEEAAGRLLAEGQAEGEGVGSGDGSEGQRQLSDEALREVVGTLLRSDELCQLAKTHRLLRNAECNRSSKDELTAAVLDALEKMPAHRARGLEDDVRLALGGAVLRVSDSAREAFSRVQRLFFLSETQSLSSLILSDIGARTYPHYVCSASAPVFATREELLEYEQALDCGREVEEAVVRDEGVIVQGVLHRCLGRLEASREGGKGEMVTAQGGGSVEASQEGQDTEVEAEDARGPSMESSSGGGLLATCRSPARSGLAQRFCAGEVLATAVTVGVSWLEKHHRYTQASSVLRQLLSMPFCEGRRGHWWLRLSVNLQHQRQVEAALVAAEEGVEDWRVKGGDLVALQRRVVRLGRPPRRWKPPCYAPLLKWKAAEVRILGRPLNRDGSRSRFYGISAASNQGLDSVGGGREPSEAPALAPAAVDEGGALLESCPGAAWGGEAPRGTSLPGPEEQCNVEELALQHYASQQGGLWEGIHAEGSVWRTLFGLCFWDIVFGPASEEGVFRHPFQTAPLDFGTPGFYEARQGPIEARLQLIREGGAVALVQGTWAHHQGTLASCVAWEGAASLEQLCAIAEGVGGTGLASLLGLLAQDLGFWSSGMPDLVLWRRRLPPGPRELAWEGPLVEVKLVEVKGPRDVLSDQQHFWLRFLAERGVSAEVCKIVEDESKL